jgi:hypothetical protein
MLSIEQVFVGTSSFENRESNAKKKVTYSNLKKISRQQWRVEEQ